VHFDDSTPVGDFVGGLLVILLVLQSQARVASVAALMRRRPVEVQRRAPAGASGGRSPMIAIIEGKTIWYSLAGGLHGLQAV
jgi:hypothetical protein